MAAPAYRDPLPGERYFYGGLSCVLSAVATNPMDLAKVRMQVRTEQAAAAAAAAWQAPPAAAAAGQLPPGLALPQQLRRSSVCAAAAAPLAAPPRRLGMAATLAAIVRSEGPAGLMRGVTPSMLREASYSTIRYGAYEPIKQLLQGGEPRGSAGTLPALPLWKKVAAGGAAGALGAACATPSDLIKVRMQAAMRADAAVAGAAHRPHATTIWQAATRIYRLEGGLAGLYRGVWPTTVRAAILTASQLPVYDEAKHRLMSHPLTAGHVQEGPLLHFACSMAAGLACAFTTGPVDFVKTCYMNQGFCGQGRPQRYSGMLDCAVQIVRRKGVPALWTGFVPSWTRLGPHTCISLLIFEWQRKQAGLAPI